MVLRNPNRHSTRGRLAFLVKDSAVYGGAAAISKAFSFITFPLLARHFSVTQYGTMDFFLGLSGFFATLIVFGQDSAVARYFCEQKDYEDRCQLVSESLLFQLIALIFILPILWWGASQLTAFLIEAPDAELLLKLVLLQVPFLVLINFAQNLLKWTFERGKFLIVSLGFTIVQASLLVCAVRFLDIDVQGALAVGLCTSAMFGVLGLFFVRRWIRRPRGFTRLREILPYATPFGVICVLSAFLPTLERSLTSQLLGSEQLGLYAAGTKVALVIGLMVNAFQTAWGPFSLSVYKQADAMRTYNYVLKIFAPSICLATFLLALFAEGIINVLASDRYVGAATVVLPLAMGLAVQATSWITEIGISISKRSYLNIYAYLVFVAATVGGIGLLARPFGVFGVALGVLSGHIARALLSSWLAQRVYPLQWRYTPAIVVFLVSLVMGGVAMCGGKLWGAGAYSLILTVGVVSISAVTWWMVFDIEDRSRILDKIHRCVG